MSTLPNAMTHRCRLRGPLGVALALALLATAAPSRAQRAPVEPITAELVAEHGGRVLIGLRPALPGRAGIEPAGLEVAAEVEALGGAAGRPFRRIPVLAARIAPEDLSRLLAHPRVAYVEPDYRIELNATRAAAVEEVPWGVDRVRASAAWNAGDVFNAGAGVRVGIMDTGGDPFHEDVTFAGGVDGRFLVLDDPPGAEAPENWADENPTCGGHGTHVAGTVGAEANNGVGVVGVAPDVDLYALRVFAHTDEEIGCPGFTSRMVAALGWAVDNGIQVVNMSFGTPTLIMTLQAAIEDASAAGVVLISSTGNQTSTVWYPAAFAEVIAVSATDIADDWATFSNYGPEVDVAAPGVLVPSTVVGGYGTKTGTSMAAPHVTGVAALLLARAPGLDAEDVRDLLRAGALDLGTPGRDDFFGHGRVDAMGSVTLVTGTSTAEIASNVPVGPLSGAAASEQHFFITVPTGAVQLRVDIGGGSGDADLYVRFEEQPTVVASQVMEADHCVPFVGGNDEACNFPDPPAGNWHIMLHGFSAYSGVTLMATIDAPARSLTMLTSPDDGAWGEPFGIQPEVQLQDELLNPVAVEGVVVAVRLEAGSGRFERVGAVALERAAAGAVERSDTLTPAAHLVHTAVTDETGVARFDGLVIVGEGTHELVFASADYEAVLSQPFVVGPPNVTELTSGEAVAELSGAHNARRYYRIDVPENATRVDVAITGGAGDADLYLRQDAVPTATEWDCRPFEDGNDEACGIEAPTPGQWFILLHGFQDYEGVTLSAEFGVRTLAVTTQPAGAVWAEPFETQPVLRLEDGFGNPVEEAGVTVTASVFSGAGRLEPVGGSTVATSDADGVITFSGLAIVGGGAHALEFSADDAAPAESGSFTVSDPVVTELASGLPLEGRSGVVNSRKYYRLPVPEGAQSLEATLSGGTGDASLYVRRLEIPDTDVFECESTAPDNEESCVIDAPEPGDWFVMLHGVLSYEAAVLTVAYPTDPLTLAVEPTGLRILAVLRATDTLPDTATITITGGGADEAGWTATKTAAWATLEASSGTGSGVLRWARVPAELEVGVYVDTITITVAGAQGSPALVLDTLEVREPLRLALDTTGLRAQGVEVGDPVPDSVAVTVTGTGAAAVVWSAARKASWLALVDSSGTGSGTLRWTRVLTGLDPGTYIDTIRVTAAVVHGSPAELVDTLVVQFRVRADLGETAVENQGLSGSIDPISRTTPLTLTGANATTAEWEAASSSAWLVVETGSGAGSGELRWHIDPTGLLPGAYRDSIRVTVTDGTVTVGDVVHQELVLEAPPVDVDAAIRNLLTPSASLDPVVARYLDLVGNRDGEFNLGDVLALLDRLAAARAAEARAPPEAPGQVRASVRKGP